MGVDTNGPICSKKSKLRERIPEAGEWLKRLSWSEVMSQLQQLNEEPLRGGEAAPGQDEQVPHRAGHDDPGVLGRASEAGQAHGSEDGSGPREGPASWICRIQRATFPSPKTFWSSFTPNTWCHTSTLCCTALALSACQKSVTMLIINYRFLSRERKWVWLAMKAFSFRNPYTKQVEYIICTNVVMKSKESSQQRPQQSPEQLPNPQPMDFDRRDMTEKFVRSTIANQALLEVTSQQDSSMPQDQVINDIFTMITPVTSQPQTQAGMFSSLNPGGSSSLGSYGNMHSSTAPSILPNQMYGGGNGSMSTAGMHGTTSGNWTGGSPVEGAMSTQINSLSTAPPQQTLIGADLHSPHFIHFPSLFDQVDADPFNPIHPLKDLDLDSILD